MSVGIEYARKGLFQLQVITTLRSNYYRSNFRCQGLDKKTLILFENEGFLLAARAYSITVVTLFTTITLMYSICAALTTL